MKLQLRQEVIKADFLVIGCGISGLQAGITAAKAGMNTLILEKANTKRS